MKNVNIFAEDINDNDTRKNVITIAQNAFNSTVITGKVCSTLAGIIRNDLQKYTNSVNWCCVVGKSFGACITQEMKSFMYVREK